MGIVQNMDNKERLKLLIISFIGLATFLFLSFLVQKDFFRSLDYQLMVNMQNDMPRFIDVPFSYVTLSGSSEIITISILLIFLGILWTKKHLFLGLFLYFFIFLIELAGKLFIFHPDPPAIFNRYSLDFHFPSSFVVNTSFSYPSGHMARTSFLGVIVLYLFLKSKLSYYRKIFFILFIIFFLIIVFISRIYLGEHWLSDVLGGVFLGSTVATFAISFW